MTADKLSSICKFTLPHKQFWRAIFATRHIKDVCFSECALTDMKSISDQLYIDSFLTIELTIRFSAIITLDENASENSGAEVVIDNLAVMKKVESKNKNRMKLNFSYSDIKNDDMVEYIKSKNLEDVFEILI